MVGSLDTMEGRRNDRGRGWVRATGGGGTCPPAEVADGGAVGEGQEARCAGPQRELFHMRLTGGCKSTSGGNAAPRLGLGVC